MTFDQWWEEQVPLKDLAYRPKDLAQAAWQASRAEALKEAAELLSEATNQASQMIHYPWHLRKTILAIAEKEHD